MSAIGTVRLTAAQEEEMSTMGFPNASKYIQWKMDTISPEEAGMKLEALNGFKEELSNKATSAQNIQDAVRLAKAEAEAERLRAELAALRNTSSDTLGNLDNVVNDRVQTHLRDLEFLQLKNDKEKLLLEAKQKEQDYDRLKNELDVTNQKIKTMEMIKQFAPIAQPILAGVGRGIAAYQSGGGLAGFFAGFESIGETPGIGGPSAITPEDQEAMELGNNLKAMFNGDELQQVLFTVALMGRDKKLISMVPQFIHKITSSNNQEKPVPPASSENIIVPNEDLGSEGNDDLEESFTQ